MNPTTLSLSLIARGAAQHPRSIRAIESIKSLPAARTLRALDLQRDVETSGYREGERERERERESYKELSGAIRACGRKPTIRIPSTDRRTRRAGDTYSANDARRRYAAVRSGAGYKSRVAKTRALYWQSRGEILSARFRRLGMRFRHLRDRRGAGGGEGGILRIIASVVNSPDGGEPRSLVARLVSRTPKKRNYPRLVGDKSQPEKNTLTAIGFPKAFINVFLKT